MVLFNREYICSHHYAFNARHLALNRHSLIIWLSQVNLMRVVGDSEDYLRKKLTLEQQHKLVGKRRRTISQFEMLVKALFHWFRNLRQFCLESSLHGLRFIVEKERTLFER